MKLSSIKETCLYVENLNSTKSFYEDTLGLEIISFAPERHIFFRVGKDVLLCFNPEVTKKELNLPPHFSYGKQHIAFEVSSEVYYSWKNLLINKGVTITHEHHWKDDLYSFYFEDPDGHVLEILMPGVWD